LLIRGLYRLKIFDVLHLGDELVYVAVLAKDGHEPDIGHCVEVAKATDEVFADE